MGIESREPRVENRADTSRSVLAVRFKKLNETKVVLPERSKARRYCCSRSNRDLAGDAIFAARRNARISIFRWTAITKKGALQAVNISRTGQFVWIERKNGRPWSITPEESNAFVRAVSG
jgi:hypothetical protein